ncbi:MAG: glutamate 5-kinase [marine bacterium B5-7]|nr:MAG: glutamate 5-kinase [marine bacterium B5-7]
MLTGLKDGLNQAMIDRLASMIAAVRGEVDIVVVSSGSIAEGLQRLGWHQRPHEIYKLQAAAAVGQMGLIQAYETAFGAHGIKTAQVLLTSDDLDNRKRYLNARSTLTALLNFGVVPVINENDTVITEEIQFGDNDTLAALVANLLEAEYMILFTDKDGLYDRNPDLYDDARLIDRVKAGDARLEEFAGAGGVLGRGGMLTKVRAAQKAARSGTRTVIAAGTRDDVLKGLLNGQVHGTLFEPASGPIAARKRWLAGQMRVSGRLILDDGAVRVLKAAGRSLLPVGVTAVEGEFERGALVACFDRVGMEIARGLINYASTDAVRIAGFASERIEAILGYIDEPELIHRDNMVLVADPADTLV